MLHTEPEGLAITWQDAGCCVVAVSVIGLTLLFFCGDFYDSFFTLSMQYPLRIMQNANPDRRRCTGCARELSELLNKAHFSPSRDRLLLTGDAFARGPDRWASGI